MGSPYHISESASPLFFQDKASAEYEALSIIAKSLAHPQRTVLSTFILQAIDRESASRFFLHEISAQNKATIFEFLADWIHLMEKVRPVLGKDLDTALRQSIWQREGGQCCISKVKDGKKNDEKLALAYIIPPSLPHDIEMAKDGKLYKMFAAYVGEPQLQNLLSVMDHSSLSSDRDISDQLILVSLPMFEHLRNGRLSLRCGLLGTTNDSLQCSIKRNWSMPSFRFEAPYFVALENKAPGLASLPSTHLLEVHRRFANALAWLEVSEHMKQPYSSSKRPKTDSMESLLSKMPFSRFCPPFIPRMLRHLWVQMPVWLRAFAYRGLASASNRFYGHTGSDRTFRLPFNLYLRVGRWDWAPKHRAEFQSLQLVENHTRIPAPRAIDTIQYSDSSFLLMTGLPGNNVGEMLSTMTDEQVRTVVQDLKEYVAELRQIPNNTDSGFQICNALGGGILDWRISDSQREELKFKDETEFSKYLTYDLPLDENACSLISKSHSVKHEIVFTHADLNLRNILVDGHGKISGIVDWECAGWYPEYWEYTKAHFSMRYAIRWTADVIDQVFDKYRNELQVEDMLSSMAPSW
ncbi:kinase-like protein [Melanomma pulvis-pyrius CBS 109.77]|uniref:Kinase-like protein n=1 Tax=Melanomma pulvis-pyrius CBS 109.77 TaxID=1314802 RepID=A0A6A6WSZ2_9PLEO|nr:kinase-like protein [Melanomma pulvis-pyrius CBS 109.77]